MSEKKPDPIEDVREGLGLLFRAAKNAVRELPTDKLEETLKTGVREVGKAVESVASTIEREVFGTKKDDLPKAEAEPPQADGAAPPNAGSDEKASEEGVRISADPSKPDGSDAK